jgi:polar amino acid transport system substrate-binding protein
VKAGKAAVNIVGTDGSPDTRLQLNQGRADAAVRGAETIVYQNSVENNRYAVVGTPFMVQQMELGFDKKDPQLGEALKKALAALIADGTYQTLASKWSLNDSAITQPMINGQP